MAFDTGHGATLTLSTNSGMDSVTGTVAFTSIGLGGQSINDVETSHLETTGFRTYIPGDLKDTNELSLNLRFNPEDADLNPTIGTVETVTVTFPISNSGNTTNATLAGTGYVKSFDFPTLETDTVQDGSMTIKFDGGTGPTFTEESA